MKDTKGHLSKLEDRSKPMIFIGYELGSKGYKCFDPANFKVVISQDVIFEEEEKWNWSTQGDNSHSLTVLPNFLSNQAEEDGNDQSDEEVKVSTPSTKMTSSSSFSEDHPPRYRSLTNLYPQTIPITQDEQAKQAYLLLGKEPPSYSEASQK